MRTNEKLKTQLFLLDWYSLTKTNPKSLVKRVKFKELWPPRAPGSGTEKSSFSLFLIDDLQLTLLPKMKNEKSETTPSICFYHHSLFWKTYQEKVKTIVTGEVSFTVRICAALCVFIYHIDENIVVVFYNSASQKGTFSYRIWGK